MLFLKLGFKNIFGDQILINSDFHKYIYYPYRCLTSSNFSEIQVDFTFLQIFLGANQLQ